MRVRVEPKEIASVYLHIANSGVTFAVEDREYGPEFVVRSSAFGNLNHEFRVKVSREGLFQIRKMLDKAIDHPEYTKTYCHPARADTEYGVDGSCEGGVCDDGAPLKDREE